MSQPGNFTTNADGSITLPDVDVTAKSIPPAGLSGVGQPKVIVKINNKPITGWTYATINASLERVPRTFELGVIQQVEAQGGDILGQPLEIWLNHGDGTTDKVLTGYLDTVQDSLQESSHEITFAGRGVCSDLVDCSTELTSFAQLSVNQNNEVIGMSAAQVAKKICGYYDIQVVVENELANKPYKFTVPVNVGDSAFSAIEYVARATLCLLYEDANGSLVLGAAGSEPASQTVLTHYKAIRSTLHYDISSVFGDYEILANPPWIDVQDVVHNNPVTTGTAHDPTFDNRVTAINRKPRHRKFRKIENFVADPSIYGTDSTRPQQIFANYICNRLNGRAQMLSVTVQGWTDESGQLWRPNQTVVFNLPYQNRNGALTWLISDCVYSISPEDGTTTTLNLMPSTAFSFEPLSGQSGDITQALKELQTPTGG